MRTFKMANCYSPDPSVYITCIPKIDCFTETALIIGILVGSGSSVVMIIRIGNIGDYQQAIEVRGNQRYVINLGAAMR